MAVNSVQQLNNLGNADFKLSLAPACQKASYLASGADYYVPQNTENAEVQEKHSKKKSALFFIASALGLVAICGFMPEIRSGLSKIGCFKDIYDLQKLEKSDKFLSNLKRGFMETVGFISDKAMALRTSFKTRKM